MGRKIVSLIFGIIFGISLFAIFYLFFVLGLAVGIGTGNNILFLVSYLFIPLGIIAIVGSALIFKSVMATKIMLIIPTIFLLITSIYAICIGIISPLFIVLIAVAILLGLVPSILSFTIKKEEKHALAHIGEVKVDKDTMKIDESESNN